VQPSIPSIPYFDSADLERAENIHRVQLRSRPEDTALRLSLAWCLLVQAIHRSGQETVLAYSARTRGSVPPADTATAAGTAQRSAHALFKDSLFHTVTVQHMSLLEEDQLEVARLHSLVALAGAQELSNEAEAQSVQRLAALARAVMRTAKAVCYGMREGEPPLCGLATVECVCPGGKGINCLQA